ncbi:MAG: GNAT family N-acetyltransferase [Anaerolineales bacterium]|nr:GNAT family N-acetyltransferase [Anaerolineales bacterium]
MLIGEKTRLRLVEEEDLAQLVAWRNEPSIWAGFFNKFPLSLGGQKEWYARLMQDPTRRFFMICTVATGEAIGTIALEALDFANGSVEIGNVLIGQPAYLGAGYAKEAIELLLALCFLRLNLNRVYLHVYADNARAIGLYRAVGFRDEGLLREAYYEGGGYKDGLVLSLLRREYSPREVAA